MNSQYERIKNVIGLCLVYCGALLFSCINCIFTKCYRLFYVGAQNKQFPTFMSMIDMKRMTPSPSLFVIVSICFLRERERESFSNIFFKFMAPGALVRLYCIVICFCPSSEQLPYYTAPSTENLPCFANHLILHDTYFFIG